MPASAPSLEALHWREAQATWGDADTESLSMRSEFSGCQGRPGLAPHSSGEHGGIRDEDSAQDSMRERRRQGQRNSRDGRCIVVMGLRSQLLDGEREPEGRNLSRGTWCSDAQSWGEGPMSPSGQAQTQDCCQQVCAEAGSSGKRWDTGSAFPSSPPPIPQQASSWPGDKVRGGAALWKEGQGTPKSS